MVRSLEKLSRKILLPNGEGAYIEHKVAFSGLLGQCLYCRNMGNLAWDCPRRKQKGEEQQQRCEFCRKEGHVDEKFQEKLSSVCREGRAGLDMGKQHWVQVNAKLSFKSSRGLSHETYQSPNSFDALDIGIDGQDGGGMYLLPIHVNKRVLPQIRMIMAVWE